MGLKPGQDAYGHMIYDHLQGASVCEVIERDDGFVATSGGPPDYFAEFSDWQAQQRRAMKYVRGRVLDVGAGAGRCSLYLQKKGHDVLAMDLSPLAIRTCRLRGVKKARTLSITEVGRKLGEFDTILMMGNNFG
ncbi:MAG: class I SAM-dependent methyltransferase, partial [Planctomycetota bacterium]